MLIRVLKRMPFALPVLRMDRLASVMPTCSAKSLEVICRSLRTLSRFTRIIYISDKLAVLGFKLLPFLNQSPDKISQEDKESIEDEI